MNYIIDYSDIFFNKYELSEKEKEACAKNIIEEILKQREEKYFINDGRLFMERRIDKSVEELLKDEFFILLSKITPEEKKETVKKEELFNLGEKYLKQNYLYDDFSVQELCEYMGVSRSDAEDLFMEYAFMSVKEYLKVIRVQKAESLIKCGEKISVVAGLCGFGSVKTMERAFKERYNLSPSERCSLDIENIQ